MKPYLIILVLFVQVACASFFVSDIVTAVFGIPLAPINWQLFELIEIGAAVGLSIGVVFGIVALRDASKRSARAEEALRIAQSAFQDVLEEKFNLWALTPAEKEVALLAIKGFSTLDMAELRGVSEGTIKAQTAAIYRKAGVSGRPQLLSVFIDDLIDTEDHGSVA